MSDDDDMTHEHHDHDGHHYDHDGHHHDHDHSGHDHDHAADADPKGGPVENPSKLPDWDPESVVADGVDEE